MYIKASSNISIQDSFQKKGFSGRLIPADQVENESTIDWASFISRSQLRRLSPVLKSAIACAIDCKNQHDVTWGAIIVGTGLGCIRDTERFLMDVNAVDENGLISPTSFIQSTHNTISGQISILTGNHNYNMTHSHRLFSFENSLIDAESQLLLGSDNILVGGCEESIPLLEDLTEKMDVSFDSPITAGSSFVVLSSEESHMRITKTIVNYDMGNNYQESVEKLIEKNDINLSDVDLVINASVSNLLLKEVVLNLNDYMGVNMSLSALGLAVAMDKIQTAELKKIVIFNGYKNHASLILLEACGSIG